VVFNDHTKVGLYSVYDDDNDDDNKIKIVIYSQTIVGENVDVQR
jgi:hypothetical protein